jgi:hypothetical protein
MSGAAASSQKEPKKPFFDRFMPQELKRTNKLVRADSNAVARSHIVYPAARNTEAGSGIVRPAVKKTHNYDIPDYDKEDRTEPRIISPASWNVGNFDNKNYDIEEEPTDYWRGPVRRTTASDDRDGLREDIDLNVLAILLGRGGASSDNFDWPSDWGWVYGEETTQPELWDEEEEESETSCDSDYGRPYRRDTRVESGFQAPRVREATSPPDLLFAARPATQNGRRIERRNQWRDQETQKAQREAELRKREAQKQKEAERRKRELRARKAQEEREAERKERERERKAQQAAARQEKENALKQIQAWVEVLKVNRRNSLENGGPAIELSHRNLVRLAWVRHNFLKHLSNYRIQKIQFIYNDNLYKRFERTKIEFRRHGKPTKEMLLFHGTKPENVNRYSFNKSC